MTTDVLRDMAANPPLQHGDAIGSLQWTDFRTGKVQRWTVLRGDRVDRVMLRAPDGRTSKAHGWTWVMVKLRSWLCGRHCGI